ncbi:vWA domain-containing protein [Allorhizocola rhizosphaerae]|uniref:vWA domain-containing protein n=1 Tax=Allorhizocola rhizosphaerae TaxID=1872709 RepID=UPI000E3DCA2E|nr:substrate-binding domain-containing protein [Allorhizocola rhizosphaerae]
MSKGGEEPSPKRDFFVAAMGMTAMAAGQLSTGWPETALQWGFLIGGSIAVGLAALSDTIEELWQRALHLMRSVRPLPLRQTVLAVVVVVLVVLTGRLIAAVGPPLAGAARVELFGCPQPVQLRVLTTPEGLPSARELTEAFEARSARSNFRCPKTLFYVYPAEPAKAREALSSGWGPEHLAALGPRPDLWLPGSTHFPPPEPGDRLSHVESVSVASSPIVLAVPEGLSGVDPRELTWAQALDNAQRSGWDVARPEPSGSLVGMLATIAVYDSLGVRQGRPLDAGQARGVERAFERALDAGGYSLSGLLCRHAQPEPPRSAVIVSEQELARFNRGMPLGGQCAGATSAHGRRMTVVRPSPTRTLDHPLVRLQWTDAGSEQTRQARAFAEWLTGPEGHTALSNAGLRPGGVSDGRPTPDDMRLVELHEQATRPGRILLALDTSFSMRQPLAAGVSRFSVAAQGVTRVVAMASGRDELGLWVFPAVGGRRELLPVGPRAPLPPLDGIVPVGPTPLYQTIADGVRALPPGDEAARALVVLTDGEDSGGGLTAQQMLGDISGKGVRVFVVAVGEANCASQALAQATQGTGGACLETDFAGLQAALEQVFTLLWKGV